MGGSRIGYPQHQLFPVRPVDLRSNLYVAHAQCSDYTLEISIRRTALYRLSEHDTELCNRQHFTPFNARRLLLQSDPTAHLTTPSLTATLGVTFYSTVASHRFTQQPNTLLVCPCQIRQERLLPPHLFACYQDLPSASPSYCTFRLIAIPATSPALGSPFMRAYPPALEALRVPREVFLQFLDHLNRVAVASPPVQVLGLAGNIAGMVPLHTAQVVGSAVNLAAKLTTVALSKGRTELLLRESNETIFEPCGLKVEVAKLDVVAMLAGIPILDSDGNISKPSTILPPMENETHDMPFSSQDRRIMALAPWLSPLDMDMLPALDMPPNAFSKMHTHVSERQRKKEEEKLLKNRATMQKKWLHTQEVTQEYEAKMDSLTEKEQAIRAKGSRRMSKELSEVGRKRESITKEFEKRASRSAKNHQKDKEESNIRKI